MIPLSAVVSAEFAKPFVPNGPVAMVLAVLSVIVTPDSIASEHPSPSLSTSNRLTVPSPSVSSSLHLVVVPLKVTLLALMIISVKTLGLLVISL